ncbi:MAG: efflux RND transporter periplasmic adaptor subunit, partial [Lachnospiraceae bacterium]|nr:efflux RND transporter periplasmic adaptor subunit [Lachnospiraceae bacterium]
PTAPIDGVIEAVNVQAHDFDSPQSPAFVISNKNTMTVTFGVSEGIRGTLRVGQKIQVDRNGKLYDAAITELGSMVDQTTGLFMIKSCVSTPDASLLTGSSVKVTAETYSQTDALLIPYDAVYYDDSQPYVYVAENGTAKRKDVETGIFDMDTITVLSGLSAEDTLITSWSANLREGAEVSVQMTAGNEKDGEVTADGEETDSAQNAGGE